MLIDTRYMSFDNFFWSKITKGILFYLVIIIGTVMLLPLFGQLDYFLRPE